MVHKPLQRGVTKSYLRDLRCFSASSLTNHHTARPSFDLLQQLPSCWEDGQRSSPLLQVRCHVVFYADVSIKHARVVTRDPLTLRVARGIDTILVVYIYSWWCMCGGNYTHSKRSSCGWWCEFRERVAMPLNLGDTFPNFTVDTTKGKITYHDFLGSRCGGLTFMSAL